MKEKFTSPHSPSESFSNDSYDYNLSHGKTPNERYGEKLSVLDSEAAAYAAKPWMDVAVELHDAKNAAFEPDEGETVYDYGAQGSLDSLTNYAERRAHQAHEGKRGDELTDDEQAILDVFKAEAEMNVAESNVNIDNVTEDQMDQAWQLAHEREKAARADGNTTEARNWQAVKERATEYNENRFGNLDSDEQNKARRKIFPNAENAGYLLDTSKDGIVEPSAGVSRPGVLQDAVNMRKTAQMYDLIAEVQAQARDKHDAKGGVPNVEVNDMLKKQYEMVANQEASFASQVDPDVLEGADFSDASKQIRNTMKEARAAGDETKLQQWQELYRGMTEYTNAFMDDSQDELPEDIAALMRRRDFMQFLASTNPKQEQQPPQKVSTNPEQIATSEYDPDTTVLPTHEKGRSAMRRNFANNYFFDKAHQTFTEENVKLLSDYMVHELRAEADYARRHNARVSGNQSNVFGAVFTLDALEKPYRAVNKFAYELVKNNTKNPDLMYAQFEEMSTKDIAQAIGFDITQYVDDYDRLVVPYISKNVTEEKPYEMPPMR